MAKHLVVVESPAKAKTIQKYLGKDFAVLASFGHVRDLIPKEGAVDPNNQFEMKLQIIEKNAKHVDTLAKAARQAESLYLATDPDREGEAISFDVYELLKAKRTLSQKPVHRIVFHEITQNAVKAAIEHPREIDMHLVQAQRTRRALDYLVGFTLSPLLWKKIRRGLSAGRVQSPALRMIVEREQEIERFKAQEYWNIHAEAFQEKQLVSAKLIEYKQEKVSQFTVTTEAQAAEYTAYLTLQANNHLTVVNVEKKQRKRQPSPPFITSTLQQEAARKLGFTTRRTMRVAQQLYEGIDIGRNTVGLITYMRTDSVNLANEAIAEIRDLILKHYDKDHLPDEPRIYKTKAKNAQEAHEAIRPTSAMRTPDTIKDYLNDEQFKLYSLIWKRTVSSQMVHATIDTVAVNL
ncbi:MAG: topA, partial [Gammaproteobacteria bacterium]|nr:topA [Gammaproteobacteria bacterium]